MPRTPIPFVGGSYEGRSTNINAQRCVNFYPVLDQQGGKVPVALMGTPGLVEFCDTGNASSAVRGMFGLDSYLYAIVGTTAYRIDAGGTAEQIGTIETSSGYCYMEYNGPAGDQIMIVDGSEGYIYDVVTSGFQKITDADFPTPSSLTYQDGYFIVSKSGTGEFYISASYNGLSWNGSNYATAEGHNDDLLRAISDHRELWLIGNDSTEVWYNSAATFPFERKIDDIIQRGIIAPASVAQLDNTLFWLDNHGMAIRMQGYTPVTVSTRQIEYQWQTYSDLSDAIGWGYVHEGHSFYVLCFPSGNATWVFDVSTGFWHERQSFPSPFDNRWRANCYAKFNENHYVGDHGNGKIYRVDLDTYTDDGNEIRSRRAAQYVHDKRLNVIHDALEVDFEAGVGLVSGQGDDPQAYLRWSDDGGKTWSNEHWASIGKLGEYETRVRWRRLGRSRNRVYEVTVSDPVKKTITGAYLDARGTSA